MGTRTLVSPDLAERNPIKAAIQLSHKASEAEIENNSVELQRTTGVLERIKKMESSLLPIEKMALPAIHSQKAKVSNRVKQLESLDYLREYRIFSLEPLKWRNNQGFPRLAVFNITSPNCEFAVVGRREREWERPRWKQDVTPKLPKEMMDCYKDVLTKLAELAKEAKKTVRLKAQLSIILPDDIRQKIIEVRKQFKEIFIIAEAPNWSLKQIAIPKPKKDPLVVGYDGANYWLVAAFDQTPLEKYIEDEFCVKA